SLDSFFRSLHDALPILIFVMLLICIAFGTACSASNDRGSADADTENETITIEHELDTTEVMKNPETVVVFDFGILDSMDQLGLEIGSAHVCTPVTFRSR